MTSSIGRAFIKQNIFQCSIPLKLAYRGIYYSLENSVSRNKTFSNIFCMKKKACAQHKRKILTLHLRVHKEEAQIK